MRALPLLAVVLLVGCPGPQQRADADLRCGDLSSFKRWALRDAQGAAKAALERWNPPAPVPRADRLHLMPVAREVVSRCATPEIVELTSKLVSFPTIAAQYPAGAPGPFSEMGAFLEAAAAADGLGFSRFGQNDAWEISLGEGPPGVAFIVHGDVVPAVSLDTPPNNPGTVPIPKAVQGAVQAAAPGWSHPPFSATLAGGRLYGRGAEDDKGPLAAALVVMRTLSRMGLRPTERMVLIIGNGEEHDWAGMQRYAQSAAPPRYPISLDSNFPVVVGEMGWVGWHLTSRAQPGRALRCAEVVDARAGDFMTQVPAEAMATLRPGGQESLSTLHARVKRLAEAEQVGLPHGTRLEVLPLADQVLVRAQGKTAHSSVPEEGHNALWTLARLVNKVGVCEGGAATLLRVVADKLDGDHYGQRLGVGYSDPVQGALVLAPTMLRVADGTATLSINLRRPPGLGHDAFANRLTQAVAALQRAYPGLGEDLTRRYVGDPHVAELHGALVPTLLEIYRRTTNDPGAKPTTIRGGTYARLFKGSVSFGPSLPGRPYLGHIADEYVEVATLELLARMLVEASLRLDAVPTGTARMVVEEANPSHP